jgi:hypothetical protein
MTDQAEQVSTTGLVDAKQHPGPTTRRQYSEALKRRIVAETPEPGHRCRSCLPDDPAALKRVIGAMAQDALTARVKISRLKFQLTTASSFHGGAAKGVPTVGKQAGLLAPRKSR